MPSCNICGQSEFFDFNGRERVRCGCCKSLERHRLIRWTLERLGYVPVGGEVRRALHLAPEEMTHRYLARNLGAGYICADLQPLRYPHAQCLKLTLPDGFDIFPDNYFDLILHNHVLEHIPGDYRDHLDQFLRMLRPRGNMVFTLPGISLTSKTLQGGEHLVSDEQRARCHGQADHYKSFGYDLLEWPGWAAGSFVNMHIPREVRIALRAERDSVYVYSRS